MLLLIWRDSEDSKVWLYLRFVNTSKRALAYFCFKIEKGFERPRLHHVRLDCTLPLDQLILVFGYTNDEACVRICDIFI
jgi:hypothetical protein